jgi:hypothetical protein
MAITPGTDYEEFPIPTADAATNASDIRAAIGAMEDTPAALVTAAEGMTSGQEAAFRGAISADQFIPQSAFGIVSGDSSDAVAESNATAIAAGFSESAATGLPLLLTGQIWVKGEVLLAGVGGTIIGAASELIQKDTSHHGLTLSTVTPPYGVRITGLKITGQGSATHDKAGIFGRRANPADYLTSDIIVRDCEISQFRTGISLASVAKFQTDNVSILGARTGMDWHMMQTAVCIATRIVSGDGDAASVCWKSSEGSFGIRVIGGEFGGSGFARFAELSNNAELNLESCNLEFFTSPQTINITGGARISIIDTRIAVTHTAAGAVISAATTGTQGGLPVLTWRNNKYVSLGRILELHGTATRSPEIFGEQIKVVFAATQGGAITQSFRSIPGFVTGLGGNVPTAGSSGNGTMFLISPTTPTSGYTPDTGLDNLCLRYFDNRRGSTKVGSCLNDALMQVWADATQIQNSTTSETDLISATIPSRYSDSVGDMNQIEAFGTTAANLNNKTFKVYLGGVAIVDFGAIPANNEDWKISVTIHRGFGGSGQQKVVAVLQGGLLIGTRVKTSQTSPTATAALVFKLTATGSATGDITMLGGKSWWTRPLSTLPA